MNQNQNQIIAELTTTKPNHVIEVSARFCSTSRKYTIGIIDKEYDPNGLTWSTVIDFAYPTGHTVENNVKRFSQKKLGEIAVNWKNYSEVGNMIQAALKARDLTLTEESEATVKEIKPLAVLA